MRPIDELKNAVPAVDIQSAFKAEIISYGMTPPEYIEPGQIIRFSDDGSKNKDGWCRLFLNADGSAGGAFGNWKDVNRSWFYEPEGQKLSFSQKREFTKQIAKAKEKADQERKVKYAQAAKEATAIWNNAKPAALDHEYLIKKQVEPYGLRQTETDLIVPVIAFNGDIQSLQIIKPDGTKRFFTSGQAGGGSYTLGDIQRENTFYICEGFATGATIHKATGNPVVIAFNTGNLKKVAPIFKEKYPDKKIIIAADNDLEREKKTGENPGVIAGKAVAKVIGAEIIICPVESDFNDLQRIQGLKAVESIFKIKEAVPSETDKPEPDFEPENIPALLADILQKSTEDPGAVFEPCALEAMGYLSKNNKPEFMRWRAKFKKIKDVSVCEIDKSIGGDPSGDDEKNRADNIIKFLKKKATFCHDSEENSFMIVNMDTHEELYPIGSRTSNKKIQHMVYTELEESIAEQTLKTVNGALACFGLFDGQEEAIFLRAGRDENSYFVDLCDDTWRVVQIDQFGWQILNRSPVRFRRTQTMQPIPEPGRKADLSALWKYINIPESDQIFVLAFILECWRPDTQKPILELTGLQGSGKSNIAEILRDLIDPNSVNLRARPKAIEDIFVSATNNWLVNYNNLSHISRGAQDALCVLATGGGYAGRQLYTNLEEVSVNVLRPVILNGISQLATAQDLIDRLIHIDVPELQKFIPDKKLKKMYGQDKPKILAGLFDLFSLALKTLPTLEFEKLPRMADFAILGESVSQVLGGEPGEFITKYNLRRAAMLMSSLDCSSVGSAILNYFNCENKPIEKMYVRDILKLLERFKASGEIWVKSAKGLADQLRRIKPGLKEAGINVLFHKRNSKGVRVSIKLFSFSGKDKRRGDNVHYVHKLPEPLPGGALEHERCKTQCTSMFIPENTDFAI